MCSVVVVSSETMAVLWSCLGFVVLCVTSHLCAAYSLAQSQQALEWPGQQSSLSFEVKQSADPFQKCNMGDYENVQCGEPGICPANCNAINCCFDGQQCYYGRAGKHLIWYNGAKGTP